MSNPRFLLLISFLALAAAALSCPLASSAQEAGSSNALTGKELAGKRIFYQRCSVCHLPPLRLRTTGGKSYGPLLKGFVQDSDTEQQAKKIIRGGSGGVMPGFQYGLRPEEIDNIVAYLKTYR